MKKSLTNVTLVLITLLLIGCSKPKSIEPTFNAEVICFTRNKAYCLHGWMIKIGNDTILSTSPIIRDILGDNTEYPLKVNIEVISTDGIECKYNYHEVVYLSRDAKYVGEFDY